VWLRRGSVDLLRTTRCGTVSEVTFRHLLKGLALGIGIGWIAGGEMLMPNEPLEEAVGQAGRTEMKEHHGILEYPGHGATGCTTGSIAGARRAQGRRRRDWRRKGDGSLGRRDASVVGAKKPEVLIVWQMRCD